MNKKNTDRLFKEFPTFWKDRNDLSKSLMGFGFECGDGWFNLIYQLCKDIQKIVDKEKIKDFVVVQVKEKFGCYDKETEVLTDKGWKFFEDLDKTEQIATLNPKTNEIEYQKPVAYQKYPYQGKMYKLETRGVDLLVTPNHQLYVSKGTYYNGRYKPPKKRRYEFEFATPDKYFGKNKRFLKSGIWTGNSSEFYTIKGSNNPRNINDKYPERGKRTYHFPDTSYPMEEFVKFLGFYVAEGCSNPKKGEISIACNNTDNGQEKTIVENLIKGIGKKIKITMQDKSACVFRIYDIHLAKWLNDNCGHLAPNKKVPKFILFSDRKLIKLFLDYLFKGDGHKAKTSHILTTTSKQLADDVQELILKAGFTSRLYSKRLKDSARSFGKLPCYDINWLKKSNEFNTQDKKGYAIETWSDYAGYVYCVTVPNHIIYVRRNGKPIWCGNSLRFYTVGENEEIEKLIREAEKKSFHTCENCGGYFKSNPKDTNWIYALCPKCYRELRKAKDDIPIPIKLNK